MTTSPPSCPVSPTVAVVGSGVVKGTGKELREATIGDRRPGYAE